MKRKVNFAETIWDMVSGVGAILCGLEIGLSEVVSISAAMIIFSIVLAAASPLYVIYDWYMTKERDKLRIRK